MRIQRREGVMNEKPLPKSSIARVAELRDKQGPPTTEDIRRGLKLYEKMVEPKEQQGSKQSARFKPAAPLGVAGELFIYLSL